MKSKIFVEGLILTLIFTSCTSDYKREIKSLQSDVYQLEKENIDLKEEIKKLKNTDQYIYNSALDLLNSGMYDQSIEKFYEMKTKYPNSQLGANADANIIIAKQKIEKYEKEQIAYFNNFINEIKNYDIEESIRQLKIYVSEEHPADLVQKGKDELKQYSVQFEKVKSEREFEKKTGLRVISVESKWDWYGSFGEQLLVPQLIIKFKNISNVDITELDVKTTFIKSEINEVFGEARAYVIGYGDSPLKPNYSKNAFLYCNVGYKNDMIAFSFPDFVADIYVNKHFYKQIIISKKYGGIDWDKK